ncbi:hypothetical protein FV246_24550 [Escherichia coli]|uniref:hypothetical protein n=1 Tax=Escherichia coli TaxID=562 RepID=UPI0011C961A4|nr:hypothetical protein [Escherichia coli]TXO63488.1 hypothetical protein FV246_24550 [Escherichia coli]
MSAQEKTVQIDSFDAKFLDINTLSKLIYERKSFVIENVSDVSETVKRVEHEIVDWPPESPDNQYHLFK